MESQEPVTPEQETIANDINKIDPNITLKEVKELHFQKLFIITKEIEIKIPSILSYIQDIKNEILNKIHVINYLFALIQNIPYNLDLILSQKSDTKDQNLNIYEILINEYILTEKNETEYIQLLRDMLIFIFRKLSLNKDIYRYLFSYVSSYLNDKNNIEKNTKYYFKENNYHNLLQLIKLFYESKDDEDPINYFYFNGDINTNITISNRGNNILSLENNLYILLFVKLVDYTYISSLKQSNQEKSPYSSLIQIKFKDKKDIISLNLIDNETPTPNGTMIEQNQDLNSNEPLKIINVPYTKFNLKETNNILLKLSPNLNLELYINGELFSLPEDIIPKNNDDKNRDNNIIEYFQLFRGFYGICSTIMVYRETTKNKLEEKYPKYLIEQEGDKKIISNYYQNGLFKEEMLIPFIKADIKNVVLEKNIFDNTIKNLSQQSLSILQNFIYYNLKSIYIPTRTYLASETKTKIEGTREINEEIKTMILVDSINNFHAVFVNNNLYQNLKYSRYGGVHILSNIFSDFSFDIGGINHLLPLIEIMTDYNELLTNANLEMFMNILLYLFSARKHLIANEQDTKFFYYLSIFLEKIPEKFYNDVSVHIKSILMTLISLETEVHPDNERFNIFNIYKEEFFNNVCLNEKILFRFSFKDKVLLYEQIYKFLFQQSIGNKHIDINITNLINILLYHEKERYTHFCCKKHAEYFKKESKIMEPELNEYIKLLINIIKLLLNQFVIDYNSVNENNINIKKKLIKDRKDLLLIFELLTFDISPCLQINILQLFFKYLKTDENLYIFLNVENKINLILLFLYKTSLFDVKELAFNYLIDLLNFKSNIKTDLGEYLDLYTTYYYYPQIIKENNPNYKQSITINNTNYVLTEFTESQKQLLFYYDKSHLYTLMNKIYEKAKFNYKEKISQEINFNILISITSKGDASLITDFLNFIKNELEIKNFDIDKNIIIYDSRKLLHWLLETCYHAYLIKNSIIKKEEFVPAFSFNENSNNEEKEKIVDNIISLSSFILIDIFYQVIFKLDYLLTWSKYYYEIKEDKNRFSGNRKFIFDYFLEKLINKFVENSSKLTFNEKLYLTNIVFEYFAYHKIKGFASGGVLKDLESLYNQVCMPFIFTLLSELKDKTKSKDDNLDLLNEKWSEYAAIKSLLGNVEFFGLEKENNMFNDNPNIYKDFIYNKHNMFFSELKNYFSNFKKKEKIFNKYNYCNRAMELIILKYHYFTLLLTVITVQMEFKEILNNFSSFILLIIIASTTISIDTSKPSNNKAKQREIWPTEEDYKYIQEIVKTIIFNFIFFLNEKIIDISKKIEKYGELKDTESQNFLENYNLIKSYLINALFFFLRLLNQIHVDTKKQEIKRKNSEGYLKGLYNKLKTKLSGEKEGIHLTGGFQFIDEFKNNSIPKKINNLNESESSDSTNNFAILEESNSFLDEIPNFTLNQIHEKDYCLSSINKKLEKLYNNNFENNENIKNYFSDNKEKYQRQIFPFVNYILKRNKLIGNIIPIYDNSIYTTYDYSFLCLKPNYIPQLPENTIKMSKISKFNKNLVDIMKRYQIRINFNEHDKIRRFRKIKKKLFSFNGILSTKKFFYDKTKYICKYRLLNHMTEDYTRIFLTPIIDMDYYLPKFSKFEIQNLFRKNNKDGLMQIPKLADLSLKLHQKEEEKKMEEKEISSLNGLYLIKEAEFKNANDINENDEGTLNHYKLFKDFIDGNHSITQFNKNNLENSCLVKLSYHIRGFFYSNSEEIGFYSYDKIPYASKKSKKNEKVKIINDKEINLIQKDYDSDREACFGSVFSPQIEKNEYIHLKIPYNKIVFIFKRRYYFKVSALEIFTSDKKSYLFKFDHNKMKDIIDNLKHYMMPKLEDIYIENNKFYNRIGFMNLNSLDENMNKKIYQKNYMNLKNIYDKWKKWEISTLRLLMILNIYANRSYNDINQYPVFPWVIIDYQSEKFPKLNSPDLMRPLNTPMGMLEINPDARQRKDDYLAHWEISRDDDDREDEYDRYGSHYSTSLYVSYYLVRVFPFAYIRIELQGTSFDDPNRLFNSMRTSFDCSSTQKSDVRELIPELFCFPEMLLNNNDFNLGEIRDDSEKQENAEKPKKPKLKEIQEVVTPKWCDNNAYSFIKKHREVLESYEVSNTLNEWLNLIFGSKQKGAEGNKIKNLYNCQTYEDYEKVFDKMPPDEQEISCRMLEFGVTPHQIFKSDASQRSIRLDSKIKNKLFFNTLENYKQNQMNGVDIKNCLSFEEIKGNINFSYAKRIFYFPKDKNSDNNKNNIYIMNNYNIDIYIRKLDKQIIQNEVNPEKMQEMVNPYYGEEIGESEYDEISVKTIEKKESIKLNNYKYGDNNRQPIVWLDRGRIIVRGGYWNGNFIIRNLNKPKDSNNIINNNEESYNTLIYTTSEYSPITKMIVDKNETFAICGNTNGTISIYHINQNNKISWSIYKNINNHNSPIVSIAIHENLNIAITCSEDGLCMLYTLPYFHLYNSFIIGSEEKNEEILCPDIVLISDKSLPCFIFYVDLKRTIYFYSINGHLLKKQKLNFSIKENTIKIYTDYQFVDYLVIYNSKNKTFDLYTMIDFTLICRSPPLQEGDFVDYVLDKDMNHILVLCKYENKYKLNILKDSETPVAWK